MAKTLPIRAGVFAVGVSLALGLAGKPARAALDVFVGARTLVKNQSLSSCNDKAKAALSSVLGNPEEYGDTGNWVGFGAVESGSSYAAAAIHCYPRDEVQGYVVTFTCVAQSPPATESASIICGKLATAFGGQQ